MTSSSSSHTSPFEWLSGGLFFGSGNAKAKHDKIESARDPLALLRGLHNDLLALADPTKDDVQLLQTRLSRIRFLLYDERRSNQQTPRVAHDTMQGLTQPDSLLLEALLLKLPLLPFESRKDVAAVFNYLLVCGLDGTDADLYADTMERFRSFIQQRFDAILEPIVQHHRSAAPDVVLLCGSMYRACLKSDGLYQELVSSTARVDRYVLPFLDEFCHQPNFDVASDAMESLRVVLTAASAAEFLQRDYAALFVDRFNPKLLSHTNYIIRRMALQILISVLLTRSNYALMMQYIVSKQNLIMVMLLLRDTSPHITFDAFHVFKIFVANPQKPPDIIKILTDNKVKLCKYLEGLHKDKESTDVQFRDEKALVIQTLEEL